MGEKKKQVISPELQKRKDAAAALADKYCSQDGGDPDLAELSKLDPLQYGKARGAVADRAGVTVKILDDALKLHRRGSKGGAFADELPPDPDPWDRPVDGSRLLRELVQAMRDHIALAPGLAETIALWVLFAHAHDCFEASPVLAVTSPTPECGKTTVLTVLGELVPRPLPASNITSAAFFRAVDKWQPTVLIDEADTFLRDSDELRGILNSGHNRRNAWIIRTQGDEHEPRRFSTWAAKAIALIGKLPPTLSSRSLHIKLQRKLVSDVVIPLRADRLAHLAPLHRKAARWTSDNAAPLKASDPEMPAELMSRAADNWRPPIAIADIAGGEWPIKARDIARKAAASERDEIAGIMLLSDLKVIFGHRSVAGLHSDEIIVELTAIEDRPWADWKAGRPITKNQLARILGAFEISPRQLKIGGINKNGYELKALKPALERYVTGTSTPPSSTSLPDLENQEVAGDLDFYQGGAEVELQKPEKPQKLNGGREVELPLAEASATFNCSACDDLGCPTCQPESFGRPPRRSAP
jgi:hypothetical protein